jgi:hypothetical protein
MIALRSSMTYHYAETFSVAQLNAVVGDAGFLARYGRAPVASDPDIQRICAHLEWVVAELRAADVAHLDATARERRARLLRELHAYSARQRFPRNRHSSARCPVFVDDRGRLCAVGHLMERSVGRDLPERIAAAHRYAYLGTLDVSDVHDWAAAHGFSLRDLAMIQPTYSGDPHNLVPQTIINLGFAVAVVVMAVLATSGTWLLIRYLRSERSVSWPLRAFAAILLCFSAMLWRQTLAMVPWRTESHRLAACSGELEYEFYRPHSKWLPFIDDHVRHGWTRFTPVGEIKQSGYYLFGHHVSGDEIDRVMSCRQPDRFDSDER